MNSLVVNLSSASSYRVVQRWIALGCVTPDLTVRQVTRWYQPAMLPKFLLVNQLLSEEHLSAYEYVVVADDDIRLPCGFLDHFLRAQTALGFSLAQPARTPNSYVDHPIVTQQQGSFARQTLWVEVGPLVSIHRSIFSLIFPFDLRSPMGWGYENIWAYELSRRSCKMGIIDEFPVDHSLRLPHSYYSWAEADASCRRLLADRPHLPLDECQQVLARIDRDPLGLSAEELERSRLVESGSSSGQLHTLLAAVTDECCSVLDWDSGWDLDCLRSEHSVFSPVVRQRGGLPYFDKSLDIVLLSSREPSGLTEACRVARLGVVETDGTGGFRFRRLSSGTPQQLRAVSIVIPTYNNAALVDKCLAALLPTLPLTLGIEVIVVDDASQDDTCTRVTSWAARDARVRLLGDARCNEGFVKACNRGAFAAKGELLILLNNDTVPQQGWLQALLRTFAMHPDAGAVGGKLLYPDGRLQEAGSVVFMDGSAANVGNGDSIPSTPLYNYLREVDYCSGALLATPRNLFLKLGALDTRYSPAYYEDVDYCFKVRATGRRVYYQPGSVVVHEGGATAGTDCECGVKRYQELNRKMFRETWNTVLTGHHRRPTSFEPGTWRALSHRVDGSGVGSHERRALVCAPTLPEFDRESGSRRIFDHIETLRATGWKVVFAAHQGERNSRYARVLEERGVETHCSFGQINELLSAGEFDLAVFAFWHIAEMLLPRARRLAPRTRVVVDSIDLHFLRNARRQVRDWDHRTPTVINADHSEQMRRELAIYEATDAVLTVSHKEASILRDILAERAVPLVAPDGEEMEVSEVPWPQRRGILFLGNFRHPPNVEALIYLCHEVLPRVSPRVRSRHPVYVVGTDLDSGVLATTAHVPNVIMVGWVPSVSPYLNRSRMLVAPLLHGAGTKRKLIQGLLSGTPTIATSVASEGLPIRPGEDFLFANDADAFAFSIMRLADDDALCQSLSERGRAAVQPYHSRQAARAGFVTAIDSVLARLFK